MPKAKRTPALQTESGFRFIRTLSIDHNAQRFRRHCERLRLKPSIRLWRKKVRAKLMRATAREATRPTPLIPTPSGRPTSAVV